MKLSAKIGIGVVTVVTVMCAVVWGITGSRPRHYEQLVQVLPSPMRLWYLNQVFDEPTEECLNCYIRIIGALSALRHHAQEGGDSDGLDLVRLVPLLDDGAFREPIPKMACDLIQAKGDQRVFKAVAQERQNQKHVTMRACAPDNPAS